MDYSAIIDLVTKLGIVPCALAFLLWWQYKWGGSIIVILQKQTDVLERLERVLLNGNHANSH